MESVVTANPNPKIIFNNEILSMPYKFYKTYRLPFNIFFYNKANFFYFYVHRLTGLFGYCRYCS
jgi:hypothetical protein